jgi:hypothetical protein
MSDPIRIRWTLSIGLVNAQRKGEFEIDREEWDPLTPDEREKLAYDLYQEEIVNYLDGGCEPVNASYDDPVKEPE